MKQRIFSLFVLLGVVQGLAAQLISFGSVEQLGVGLKVSFHNNYLYVATAQGLYVRDVENAESDWVKLPFTDYAVKDFTVRGDTLIALTKSNLYYSTDGGKTATSISVDAIVPGWKENPYYNGETSLGQVNLGKLAVHPSDAGQFYVAYKGLSYTRDGGRTWTIAEDFGDHLIEGIFYNPSDGNNLIAYTHTTTETIVHDKKAYVYATTNSGTEWKQVKGYNASYTTTLKHIAFHPTEPNKVMMCGEYIYAISENQGLAWQAIASEDSSPDIIAPLVYLEYMIYDPRNPDILYGADLTASYETDKKTRILRSTDGGFSWDAFYTIEDMAFVKSMSMHDNLLAIAIGNGDIYLLDVDAVGKRTDSKPYLVTEGKEWAICTTGAYPAPNSTTFTYRLQGDTIIDGKRYLVEYESNDIHLTDWKPSGHFMREEDGKVYRKYRRRKETILLDYGMQVGDTLRYNDRTDYYGNVYDDNYVYVCLTGIRDTIMPNGDGVSRRCYDAILGQYFKGEYIPTDWEATFVEDIGWLDWGLSDELFFTTGGWQELLYVKHGGNLLHQKEKGVYWKGDHVMQRPVTRRGYGLYHSDSYLYAYTMDEAVGVTDSTDFARWNDREVIRIDVDTIGPNAFSGATFRQGQIICFTERLNTICKDAFAGINIVKRTSQEAPQISDDLTLVFEGTNPPGIDKNNILDYSDSTCHINFVVPDMATYIAEDNQWTYTTLMTIDDFIKGYVSSENEVTVTDPTEVTITDVEEGELSGGVENSSLVVVVEARPRKDIPVRIGDGENKDIYSRAPAWQRYTVELKVTDSSEALLYEGAMACSASDACVFDVTLPCRPDDDVIYLHSRSIDMFDRATEWATRAVTLTRIEDVKTLDSDTYYDLQGRKVAHPTRGVYIKNGRKVIVK